MIRKSASFRRPFFILALIAAVAGAGCASKKPAPESDTQAAPPSDVDNPGGDSDHGTAGKLQTVHFPFDSFTLDAAAKATLKANAEALKEKSTMKIQVEGHCDQRGGIQYNIALGEKRASAVRKYLADLGVSGDRVTTISFGKEKPATDGTSEEAYAKNRRANFVITSSK